MKPGWHYTYCILCGKKRAPPHSIEAEKLTYGKYPVCKACTEKKNFTELFDKKRKEIDSKGK